MDSAGLYSTSGEKLMWDPENLKITNNEKANEYIRPTYRKEWELKDIT